MSNSKSSKTDPLETDSSETESSEIEPSADEPSTDEASTDEPSAGEAATDEAAKTVASKRSELLRRIVTFQLKLMADGLRDLVLLPVSLVAALIGYARGGDEPDRELNQVMEYGRQTEEWIDLFDQHDGDEQVDKRNAHSLASIDAVFDKVEESLLQSHKSEGTSKDSQSEIDEAEIDETGNTAQEKVRKAAEGTTTE